VKSCHQCFKGNPRQAGYTWKSKRQGVTVAQGSWVRPDA